VQNRVLTCTYCLRHQSQVWVVLVLSEVFPPLDPSLLASDILSSLQSNLECTMPSHQTEECVLWLVRMIDNLILNWSTGITSVGHEKPLQQTSEVIQLHRKILSIWMLQTGNSVTFFIMLNTDWYYSWWDKRHQLGSEVLTVVYKMGVFWVVMSCTWYQKTCFVKVVSI
jgi:hypothetical protein